MIRATILMTALIVMLAGHSLHAATNNNPLPLEQLTPGGVALIDLGSAPGHPHAWLNDVPVAVLPSGDGFIAMVGIPLSAKPGQHQLKVKQGNTESTIAFEVVTKAYKEQHITIKNNRQVNPNENDLSLIHI